MRLLPLLALALCLTAPIPTAAEQAAAPPGLDRGDHAAGYRVTYGYDHSRGFGSPTDLDGNPTDQPLWRPLQIHIWYPAERGTGAAMHYGDYVAAAAAQNDADAADPGTRAGGLAAWKAYPLRRGAEETALDAILNGAVRARRDAEPAAGRFPLILYSPSINSDPYENAALFEYLTGHGYVVAAAPSFGLHEPEVSRDAAGLRAQRDDLRHVLSRMSAEPFVDLEHLGVLGFSWGGMTGLLLALEHWGVDAVATLDGGMRFPEYRPVAESFDAWTPQRLRAPLFDVVLTDEPRVESLGQLARYADVYDWSQPGLKHRDFGWNAVLRLRLAAGDPEFDRVAATYGELAGWLRSFFDAYLLADGTALKRLRESEPLSAGTVWRHRIGAPVPPTPAQFAAIVERRGARAAADLCRDLLRADPELVPFEEDRLLRFATLWGPDRAEDLMILLELNLEVYPCSADTWFWIGQIELARDDAGAAKSALARAVELDPDHARARRLLEHLQ